MTKTVEERLDAIEADLGRIAMDVQSGRYCKFLYSDFANVGQRMKELEKENNNLREDIRQLRTIKAKRRAKTKRKTK